LKDDEMPPKNTGLALCAALALSMGTIPAFAQSNPPQQAAPPVAEQPVPIPQDDDHGVTPGSLVAGSAAGVAVVLVLILGGMLAWSEGW
jgi:hypothetical protein